jgi:hypothetical protein
MLQLIMLLRYIGVSITLLVQSGSARAAWAATHLLGLGFCIKAAKHAAVGATAGQPKGLQS